MQIAEREASKQAQCIPGITAQHLPTMPVSDFGDRFFFAVQRSLTDPLQAAFACEFQEQPCSFRGNSNADKPYISNYFAHIAA